MLGIVAMLLIVATPGLAPASQTSPGPPGRHPSAALARIEELLASASSTPSSIPQIRIELWPKLALLGPEDGDGAVALLLGRSGDTRNPRVFRFVLEALGALGPAQLGDPSRAAAADLLLKVVLSREEESATRIAAISALPALETSARVTAALQQIAQRSDLDRPTLGGGRESAPETAIRALGRCGTEDAAGRLLALWDNERVRVAYGEAILQSLAHTGDPRAQSILLERIREGDKTTNELVSEIQALGGIARVLVGSGGADAGRTQRVVEIRQQLRALCDDRSHAEVLGTAAIALARITASTDEATVSFLRSLMAKLNESDRHVVESVLQDHLLAGPSPDGGR